MSVEIVQFLFVVGVLVWLYLQSLPMVWGSQASYELALDCVLHVGDFYIQIFGAITATFRLNH